VSDEKTIKIGARQAGLVKRWLDKSPPPQHLRLVGDGYKGGTLTFEIADGPALAEGLRRWLDRMKYHGDRATLEGLANRLEVIR
jgi:hypothetical protein